jgi:uncharacterized membrane protein
MSPKFSAQEAIRFSWSKAKGNIVPFLAISFILLLIRLIPTIAKEAFDNPTHPTGISFLATICTIILSMIFNYNMTRISIRIVDGKTFEISDLFAVDFSELLNYVGATIITGFIMLGGFLLLIVPGIIWSIKYFFAPYLVVDRKMPVMSAIRESGNITYGSKRELFQFGFLIFSVNLMAALCLIVGLFITIPMSWVAIAYAYRKLAPASISS